MTLESNAIDSANPQQSIASPISKAQAFWSESEDAGDDLGFAKGPTVLIDLQKDASSEPSTPCTSKSLKYIQGIVRSDQIYIVTNLINDKSQTLYQPQMVWTIGRNRAAALPVPDRKLSRRHAVLLYVAGDGFYLVDLNSMNGSYVNDQRVQQRQRLHDGDRICIGGTEFSFFLSCQEQTLEPIHPEVLTRLSNHGSRPSSFIDFSELKEEISFNLPKR